jgi:hypothetical protein
MWAPLRWRRCGLDRFRRGDFVLPRHTLQPAQNIVLRWFVFEGISGLTGFPARN